MNIGRLFSYVLAKVLIPVFDCKTFEFAAGVFMFLASMLPEISFHKCIC